MCLFKIFQLVDSGLVDWRMGTVSAPSTAVRPPMVAEYRSPLEVSRPPETLECEN